jgi:hypothetical protein
MRCGTCWACSPPGVRGARNLWRAIRLKASVVDGANLAAPEPAPVSRAGAGPSKPGPDNGLWSALTGTERVGATLT